MKKINWKLILITLGIVLFGSLFLIYKIGDQYMWTDEIFSFHAARMILEKGKPLYDSGLFYGRSEIYNYLLAFSMKIFGINEFGSRIINILFVIGTTLLTFFFVRDTFKQSKHKTILGLAAALLYLTSNFTIASVRETRMYAMTVFFFTLSAFAFYKGLISRYSTKILNIKGWVFRYNIPWLLVFIVSFYIGYETQPISIIFGACIFIFYLLRLIIKRKKEDLLFVILLLITALLAVYVQFQTFNVYQVFLSLSPEWASAAPKLLYYPILLVRNFPGMFLLSPLIIYSLFKYRKLLDIYIFTTFGVYILFIALQKAQHERYLQPILVLLPILLVISIYRIWINIPKKNIKLKVISLLSLLVIILVPQIYLLQKELNEIGEYTKTSIAIYKKMDFYSMFDYLDSLNMDDYTLICDYHTAYTLYEKGYKVNYILVTSEQYTLDNGRDIYMNIPYLKYDETLKIKLDSFEKKIVTIRDYVNFPDIEKLVTRDMDFSEPRIYQ